MARAKTKRKGQALLLVTFALLAMCGLLGLAVDLGWGYFVKKTAQASADSGAMAGAYAALENHFNDDLSSAPSVALTACDVSGTLQAACQYAKDAGFAASEVKVSAGVGTPPTGQPIVADYWVTVRTVKTIPQLFSAVLGNPTGISSARATAAVVTVPVNGSLITLNRSADDPSNPNNVFGGGLHLPNGLFDANGADTIPAIDGPITVMRGASNPGGMPEGPLFLDPMRGLGQPPLPSAPLRYFGVVDSGNLNQRIYDVASGLEISFGASNVTLPQGNYFPVSCENGDCTVGHFHAEAGIGLRMSANVTFADSGFGSYFFYGGLHVETTASATIGPGQYVVVGGKASGYALSVDGSMQASGAIGDAGQLIILTGMSSNSLDAENLYPGLQTQLNNNQLLADMAINSNNPLGFAATSFSGNGTANMHGINLPVGDPQYLPNPAGADLAKFAGTVLWQDQANSTIKYDSHGQITCGNLNSPCTNAYPTSPNINVGAQGLAGINGVFYQPRGAALLSSQAGQSNLQIITGRFQYGGSGLNLIPPSVLLKRRIVALIE